MILLLLEALVGFREAGRLMGNLLTQFGEAVSNGFPTSGGAGRLAGDLLTQFGEDVSNGFPTSGGARRPAVLANLGRP